MRRIPLLTALVVFALGVAVAAWLLLAQGATAAKVPPPSRTVAVQWYNGDTTETVYLALDEVAVSLKSNVAVSRSLAGKVVQDVSGASGAFVDASAHAVIVRKTGVVSDSRTLSSGVKVTDFPDAKAVSPVFIVSAKDDSVRGLLSGDVIVFFKSAPDATALSAFEKTNALTFFEYVGGHDAVRFHAQNPAASFVVANKLKLGGGSVKYAYPTWQTSVRPMWYPNDPLFSDQWHLDNYGQNGATAGNDLNVVPAWDTVRGAGVTVGIVDGGVESDHPDLSARYRSDIGWDYVDGDSTPYPSSGDDDWEKHGTSVAGLVAATSNNGIGVSGVAPQASITAYRLNGSLTDADFAAALVRNVGSVDVRNSSWGTPPANGLYSLTPDAERAFSDGTTLGRSGKGTVYVFAAGNAGNTTDSSKDFSSDYSGWCNNRFVTAVAASDPQGNRASYSSQGANVRVNAPSNSGNADGGDCVLSTSVAKTRAPELFSDMYLFRDGFLSNSSTGKALVTAYYRAGAKLLPAISKNLPAQVAFMKAVWAWRPAMDSLGRDGSAVITAEQVDAAEAMAAQLEGLADAPTARSIHDEMAAANPRSFVGQPVKRLWAHYSANSKLAALSVVPAGDGLPEITTTDRQDAMGYNSASSPDGDYTNTFGGTSAASPEVAGVAALILQANPSLTWRDVQQILMVSADKNSPYGSGWFNNGAGYHVSDAMGFGRVNAARAVAVAQAWTHAGPETSADYSVHVGQSIPDNNYNGVTSQITVPQDFQVEWADVYVDIPDHTYWGDLQVTLTSPDGTQSYLARKHTMADTTTMANFRFGCVQDFGERSKGNWTLNVVDLASGDTGTLQSWRLVLHGSSQIGATANDGNNNLQTAPVMGPWTQGTVDSGLDPIDAGTVHLEAGQQISAVLVGAAGTDFDVYLCRPDANGVGSENILSGAAGTTYPDSFSWVAPYTGDFKLVVHAYFGSGAYALSYSVLRYASVARVSAAKATVKRKHGTATWTFTGNVRAYNGAPLGGRPAWLQVRRGSGSWSTVARVSSSGSGRVSHGVSFKKTGTYYVRWHLPQAGLYTSATSGSSKVTVK